MKVKLMSASFRIIADGPDRGKEFNIGQEYDEVDVPDQYRDLFVAVGDDSAAASKKGKRLEIVKDDDNNIT